VSERIKGMKRCHVRFSRVPALLAGLMLLADRVIWAQTSYQIQPIVSTGDLVGNVRIKANGAFFVGGMNDSGQILFVADNAAGGQLLLQFADGRLSPIVVAGGLAPGGTWSQKVSIASPVSVNQLGDAVFAADVTVGGKTAGPDGRGLRPAGAFAQVKGISVTAGGVW
jgi:hypothetical protein